MNSSEALEKARAIMDQHGLQEWKLALDGAVRRAGACSYRKKTIQLSEAFVKGNPWELIVNTVLHEIAHALVGPRNGHGPVWRMKAVSIGCTGQRCYDSSAVVMPEPRFVGTCPNCGAEVKRNVRRRSACAVCCKNLNGGKFDAKFSFKWRRS